jgi:hypothetical protein
MLLKTTRHLGAKAQYMHPGHELRLLYLVLYLVLEYTMPVDLLVVVLVHVDLNLVMHESLCVLVQRLITLCIQKCV